MISRKKQPRGEIVSSEHHHSTPRREPLRQNRGTVCPGNGVSGPIALGVMSPGLRAGPGLLATYGH